MSHTLEGRIEQRQKPKENKFFEGRKRRHFLGSHSVKEAKTKSTLAFGLG